MTAATSNTTFVGIAISFVSIILGVTALLNSLYTSLDILWDTKTVITKTHNKRNIFKELKIIFSYLHYCHCLAYLLLQQYQQTFSFQYLVKLSLWGYFTNRLPSRWLYPINIIISMFLCSYLSHCAKEKFSWGAILRGSVVTAILFIFGELLISFLLLTLPIFLCMASLDRLLHCSFGYFILLKYFSLALHVRMYSINT